VSLTREQILDADDLRREMVEAPEWGTGCTVTVRMMTAAERELFHNRLAGKDGAEPAARTALLVAMTACDKDGALLFGPEDVAVLAGKNGAVLERIASKAWTLNELGVDARKRLAKN